MVAVGRMGKYPDDERFRAIVAFCPAPSGTIASPFGETNGRCVEADSGWEDGTQDRLALGRVGQRVGGIR